MILIALNIFVAHIKEVLRAKEEGYPVFGYPWYLLMLLVHTSFSKIWSSLCQSHRSRYYGL